MSTPNKRRKRNGYQPSPQPTRGLAFFFEKQAERKESNLDYSKSTAECEPSKGRQVQDGELTDEQLARRLQDQWNEEDRQHSHVLGDGHEVNGADPVLPNTDFPGISPISRNRASSANEMLTGCNAASEAAPVSAEGKPPNTLSLQPATAEDDQVSYTIPFDESPFLFSPRRYLPGLKKQWSDEGKCATYAVLTHCFVLVNSTQSRIKIVDTLVNFLRTLIEGDPESLLPAVWLATNAISPPYIDVELGLGGAAISKALKKTCGLDNAALKGLYSKHGDAGDVAFEAKKKQSLTLRKPKSLTIKGVFADLTKLAKAKGPGCQEVKQRIVERLVQDTRRPEESRYIVRTLVQHLRIGAVKTTMLIALSRAFQLSRPPGAEFPVKCQSDLARLSKQDIAEVFSHGEELVKASFARRPNYNDLVPTLLDIGISPELLLRCGLALHIPLRPMLGSITRDLGEMLTKLQDREFACEFKYDGQRAQVHCDKQGKVTIFSRHLEVMTEKYPDLVALVPKMRGDNVSSFILEGEVVAIDRDSGELKPFQVLANRARKDVAVQNVTIEVCLFAFDLMYLNGEDLLDRPFRERRSLLHSLFVDTPGRFTWVKSIDATSDNFELVSDFFKEAVSSKCEGIMVKVLDNAQSADKLLNELEMCDEPELTKPKGTTGRATSARSSAKDVENHRKGSRRKALLSTYEPDKRLDSWLKVKKDYDSSSFDTIDLIPVGGWHGQGRKNAWWSPILLACRNPENGTLEVVTKCISGFTDAFYKSNKSKYALGSENVISRPNYVEYGGEPDVWFEPQEVWEMAFADITLSPTYSAAIGLVSEERGLSMRFPRFLKVREDKGIDEASTNDFLASLYRKQGANPTEQNLDAVED